MAAKGQYICQDCLRSLRAAFHPFIRRTFQRHASTTIGNSSPLRLSIIGSGPAGFYAAARVMQKLQDAQVDMYEKLPVPFGLVRYGVAPDHPEVKNCQDRFEEVASSNRFQFIGNTTVGEDVKLSEMKKHYDAILFAYGAATDRLLGIPGEQELKGIYSARGFVGWYNGLPEFAGLAPNLETDHAVVIGNGNVALDVARILLSNIDSLRKTDISDAALDTLAKSRVKRVTIAGRRGPMQAAFTIKELRELVDLPNTSFQTHNVDLIPSVDWISALPRLQQRKYRFAKLLTAGVSAADKYCHLRSLISPERFIDARNTGSLSHLEFRLNRFLCNGERFEPKAQTQPTDQLESVQSSLAFRSVGYKAVSLPGLNGELGIEFSHRSGTIMNDGLGRAIALAPGRPPNDTYAQASAAQSIPGCYCTGWVKTGPTGVIATTMEDAFSSAEAIVKDWTSGRPFLNGAPSHRHPSLAQGWFGLREEIEHDASISWTEWQAIDRLEKELGRKSGGKPRLKLKDVEEMINAAKQVTAK